MSKTAVIAIGGNSLIKDENHQTVPDQFEAVRENCVPIASMIEQGWKIAITHGNGPQVGFILLRSELASHVLHTVPLDSAGAETQGSIGYMIQQSLYNELKKRGINKRVVTVVTQVVVEKNDPAFENPKKPIGPFYEADKAEGCKKTRGWTMVEDAGRGCRRVVPSPTPIRIIEQNIIKALIDQGIIVVGVGGGGIPVVEEAGTLKGVEAVIDKDLASALLARTIGAEAFFILTDVPKVYVNFHKPDQKELNRVTVAEAEKYYEQGEFASGSMGPKILAAIDFVKNGGKETIITESTQLSNPDCGTRIVP